MTLTSSGSDGTTWQMTMRKGDPSYAVSPRHLLFPRRGTELKIKPLLPGVRQLSGDKMQWYLASELRDRIRQSGVKVKIVDRTARKEYKVEPRRFTGRLLHELRAATVPQGEIYIEIYLSEPGPENHVGLCRAGTRVLADIAEIDILKHPPWISGQIQGIVDAPFLNLTPGTRTGIIQDEAFASFCMALEPVEAKLLQTIEEQKRAEDERASREILKAIQKAFQEALLALPVEEYDWFAVRGRSAARGRRKRSPKGSRLSSRERARRRRRRLGPSRKCSSNTRGRSSAFSSLRPRASYPWANRGRFAPWPGTVPAARSSRTSLSVGRSWRGRVSFPIRRPRSSPSTRRPSRVYPASG